MGTNGKLFIKGLGYFHEIQRPNKDTHHPRDGMPRCPECMRGVLSVGLGGPNTKVDGETILFYCCAEFDCGWSEFGNVPVSECVKYYIAAGQNSEVFDISRVRKA